MPWKNSKQLSEPTACQKHKETRKIAPLAKNIITSILPGPRQPSVARLDERIRTHRAASPCSYRLRAQKADESQVLRQAVRSLGPRSCACYQASTRGLSTRSSPWDLDALSQERGKTHLGGGFALRCFQRFSFLDVAFQPWGGHPNWRTSGRAISVLSYWR